ncbi:MAG: Unknown protein [uncultured Sulfurovum sp.]|uniref:Outer membrane efflux protein n=1 Tax=uncultured Sulfurovum sp. TaxID=269237 RepID=A0A6S6U1I1_9BACT|nr:MAG: Unknown protein [uncultured Sulfurovum sp.]
MLRCKAQTMLFAFLLFSSSSLFAKTYTVNLLVDDVSQVYVEEIQKQSKALFSDGDRLHFKVTNCQDTCEKQLLKTPKKVALLEQETSLKKYKHSYLVTHNMPTVENDVNRLVRTVAMAVYELYKEHSPSKTVAVKGTDTQGMDFLKTEELASVVPLSPLSNYEDVPVTQGTLLTLPKALALAQKNNLNIQQNQNSIARTALNINEAKSYYKPDINLYANHVQIDEDRPKYAPGFYVQGQSYAGAKITQIIYSDQVIKNIEIRKKLFQGTEHQTKADNEEVLYEVVLRYLTMIQVKNYIEIVRHQKGFIEQNLNFAQQRYGVGATAKSDLLRWQSALANINSTLETTKEQLNSLKIELSTLLQIDYPIGLENYRVESPLFQLLNQDALEVIAHQSVRTFFQNEMLGEHPRLQQLDKLVEAQETSLKMNENKHRLPTVAFEGNAYRILERNGEGSDYPFSTDNNVYQAVLNVNLPIYEGGRNSVNIQQDKVDILNLKLRTKEAKSSIMERLKKHYGLLKSASQKIIFARESQAVSQESLALVQERYQNGIENIITLLDAQNTYTIAQHNQNIAVIDYLSNLSSIYFFSGEIELLSNPAHKSNIESKLNQRINN